MTVLPWLVLFIPLFASLTIASVTLSNHRLSGRIACGAIAASFLLSVLLFLSLAQQGFKGFESNVTVLSVAGFQMEFGVLADKLSALMLLVVTGVGTGIFFYSTAYMHDDPGFSRYFASLSLFAFSMLGIVLATNFIQMFIFWELVGASSYLLIGHWFQKEEAADASKKAFITTRVGDVGFMIGILILWSLAASLGKETLNFLHLEELFAHSPASGSGLITAACLLIFCGVMGKSAQFPLHVWLPDAMEGPTPVSALIHAATMVAAGVYLVARTFFLFHLSPAAMQTLAVIGCFTAFIAATMALVQDDIKRILAYSTLSQLGYMVMALGLGSSAAAMFHLTTHAFFKALLFLGAGSVIHAVHTQNIWEMGGLYSKMPATARTFLVGFLAIAGIFPLSGFWSKDEILVLAFKSGSVFFLFALVTAFMTSFYMGRLFFTVFMRDPRKQHHAHESPLSMTIPLYALAFFAVVSGLPYFGLAHFVHGHHDVAIGWNFNVVGISTVLSLLGIALSYVIYAVNIPVFQSISGVLEPARKVLLKKYYMDDLYDAFVKVVQQNFARACNGFEQLVIVGFLVNGTAKATAAAGSVLRLFQTGKIQFYALVFTFGAAILAYFAVLIK